MNLEKKEANGNFAVLNTIYLWFFFNTAVKERHLMKEECWFWWIDSMIKVKGIFLIKKFRRMFHFFSLALLASASFNLFSFPFSLGSSLPFFFFPPQHPNCKNCSCISFSYFLNLWSLDHCMFTDENRSLLMYLPSWKVTKQGLRNGRSSKTDKKFAFLSFFPQYSLVSTIMCWRGILSVFPESLQLWQK